MDASKGGIRTFLDGLVGALQAKPGIELTLIGNRASNEVFGRFGSAPNVEVLSWGVPGGTMARPGIEQLAARWITSDLGDVLLVPSNVGLPLARLPQAVVVQAPLAIKSIRERYGHLLPISTAHRLYYDNAMPPTLRSAGAIISVSAWLCDELLSSIPRLDRRRVHVVHEGVSPAPMTSNRSTSSELTILFVSTLFPYKGAEHLLTALGRVQDLRPDLTWTCRIVGGDPTGSAIADLTRLAASSGVSSKVAFLGKRPHQQVWDEYADADLFVYPSQLETFGLPPLEAMSVGVPTVVGDAPSVREVVGDAAAVVAPIEVDEFAATLIDLLDSPARRADLGERGRAKAAEFTWESTADQVVSVLDRLV